MAPTVYQKTNGRCSSVRVGAPLRRRREPDWLGDEMNAKTISRRDFAKIAAVGSMMGALPAAGVAEQPILERSTKASARLPNLLFISPDQFRLFSLGIWGKRGYRQTLRSNSDPVVTPTLDKQAAESVLFTQACSRYPVCSPYRGMLMSGMYPANNGVELNCRKDRPDLLRHDISSWTDVLHESGTRPLTSAKPVGSTSKTCAMRQATMSAT